MCLLPLQNRDARPRDGVMGARHDRVVTNAVRSPVRRAAHWMRVVSMASARVISGRRVGSRHPHPGEHPTEVQYVKTTGGGGTTRALAAGESHISTAFSGPLLIRADARDPIVLLAGVHVGCFELFGTDRVRAIRDLKGKTVAVSELGTGHHVFIASMAAYVGLDPRKDITWLMHPPAEAKRLLPEGKIDAYLGFPPDPQELRARRIGHVVVNSTIDRPWSQYFCCMVAGNREFVSGHPVATKRALRAIFKAADLCAREPERVAQLLVDHGYAERYDYALQTLQEIPYAKWREYMNPRIRCASTPSVCMKRG
jgi:NitT/TauT family transport system substrate-binding protein